MSDSDPAPDAPVSKTVPRKRARISIVWLIPIVAAAAGVWVAATVILGEGPKITIVLRSAEGLEAGKTQIEYHGVEVGKLTEIRLSKNHERVVAIAQMASKTDALLVEDTKFWVVRPRVSGGTVSGLGTLLSGAYLTMDIGDSKKSQRRFEVLENPPVVKGDELGRYFVLETPDLGSLDNGTPLFFRRLKVGEVASYELAKTGKSFQVTAFVKAPYDQYVTPATRFWHASGIDVSFSASGLDVQTQSLASILIGGIAFETPANGPVLPSAEDGAEFPLAANRAAAFKPPVNNPQTYQVVFDQAVRGLAPGAPVDFRGIPIGEVVDVTGKMDARTFDFAIWVTLRLDAARFGIEFTDLAPDADREAVRRRMIDALVSRGVRAQIKTGNLLSGALYVALDFFKDVPAATVDWSQNPPLLPSTAGQFEALEAKLIRIVDKIDQLPFKAIGEGLQKSITDLDATLVSARGTFDNASALIEPNSVLGQQLDGTLQEVSGAARAIRLLADYLERHPESLIRGKQGEAK